MTPTLEMAPLRATVLRRASIFEQQFRIRPKMLFEKAVRLDSTRILQLQASQLRACSARVQLFCSRTSDEKTSSAMR